MKMIRLLPFLILAAVVAGMSSCAPSVRTVTPEIKPEPPIVPLIKQLDEPAGRIGKVNTALSNRVAVLERERSRLESKSAEWEAEMARWQDRGLTAEQQLELTLAELRKVRANWFSQLDEATSGLKVEVEELTAARDSYQQKYEDLLASGGRVDKGSEVSEAVNVALQGALEDAGEEILKRDGTIKTQAATITRQETFLWITGSIAALAVLYLVARLLKLTPKCRPFLFWLP